MGACFFLTRLVSSLGGKALTERSVWSATFSSRLLPNAGVQHRSRHPGRERGSSDAHNPDQVRQHWSPSSLSDSGERKAHRKVRNLGQGDECLLGDLRGNSQGKIAFMEQWEPWLPAVVAKRRHRQICVTGNPS